MFDRFFLRQNFLFFPDSRNARGEEESKNEKNLHVEHNMNYTPKNFSNTNWNFLPQRELAKIMRNLDFY